MISIRLNEETIQINKNDNLKKVLVKNGLTSDCYAVALNCQFIPRALYTTTSLQENDVVDIIMPMQGG